MSATSSRHQSFTRLARTLYGPRAICFSSSDGSCFPLSSYSPPYYCLQPQRKPKLLDAMLSIGKMVGACEYGHRFLHFTWTLPFPHPGLQHLRFLLSQTETSPALWPSRVSSMTTVCRRKTAKIYLRFICIANFTLRLMKREQNRLLAWPAP